MPILLGAGVLAPGVSIQWSLAPFTDNQAPQMDVHPYTQIEGPSATGQVLRYGNFGVEQQSDGTWAYQFLVTNDGTSYVNYFARAWWV